jgi:hypothetical protein
MRRGEVVMSMGRIRDVVVVIIVGAAIGYLVHRLRVEQALNVLLQERITALESSAAKVPSITPPVAEEEANEPAPPQTVPKVNVPASDRPASVIKSASERDQNVSSLRRRLKSLYGDVETKFNLSPEEAEKLAKLVVSNAKAEIEAFWGPGRYRQWQDFTQSKASERFADDVGKRVAQTGGSLSALQTEQLASTFLAEAKRASAETEALAKPTTAQEKIDFDERTLKLTDASYRRVIETSRLYLDPAQVEVLSRSLDRQIQLRRSDLEGRRTGVSNAIADPRKGAVQVTPGGQSVLVISKPEPNVEPSPR